MYEHCIQGIENVPESLRGCALTIGNFDGVHLGHRRILRTAREQAGGERPVVAMTFEPPPELVLHPDTTPQRIDTPQLRTRHLLQAGCDHVVLVHTDNFFLAMSPEEFVRDIIVRRFAPTCVVEGQNFFYGLGRSGNIETLRESGRQFGFEVKVVEPVSAELRDGPTRISSTLVRQLVAHGRVREANYCLNREFALQGEVVRGRRIGHDLHFPTANIQPTQQVTPCDGVYAGRGVIAGTCFPAAISIGTNPTTGHTIRRSIEAHLLGASAEYYGQMLTLRFIQRLRDQVRYETIDELTTQIAKDVERVRHICD